MIAGVDAGKLRASFAAAFAEEPSERGEEFCDAATKTHINDNPAEYYKYSIAFAIKYHQALRFFPDPSVGYEYPENYLVTFGADYVPLPHVQAAYTYARNHKWYMDARMVTTNDLYSFDPNVQVEIEEFTDIIGRNFRQPKEGLGNDNTPVSHMWRTMAIPDAPL